MLNKANNDGDRSEPQKFDSARARLEEIQKRIAPLVKKKECKEVSTRGQWSEESNACHPVCGHDNEESENS